MHLESHYGITHVDLHNGNEYQPIGRPFQDNRDINVIKSALNPLVHARVTCNLTIVISLEYWLVSHSNT